MGTLIRRMSVLSADGERGEEGEESEGRCRRQGEKAFVSIHRTVEEK